MPQERYTRDDCGKRLFNFRKIPMVLLTLDVIALMCLSIKDVSNIWPKWFCDETCWTGFWLKKIVSSTTFLTLRGKIISCGCLDGLGLKFISHWNVHFFILSKFSRICLAVAFASFIIVKKEVSSAKSFGFDWRFSVRLFI